MALSDHISGKWNCYVRKKVEVCYGKVIGQSELYNTASQRIQELSMGISNHGTGLYSFLLQPN